MRNVRPCTRKEIMGTNNGDKEIKETGDWKEWGSTYLDESSLTSIVSVTDAVKKGFCVVPDTAVENCFYVIHPETKLPHFE